MCRAHEKLKLKEVPLITIVQCGKNNAEVIMNAQGSSDMLDFCFSAQFLALCLHVYLTNALMGGPQWELNP